MASLPRFDLMRGHIDGLRSRIKNDKRFIKAVSGSVFGAGFYAEHAANYCATLIGKNDQVRELE